MKTPDPLDRLVRRLGRKWTKKAREWRRVVCVRSTDDALARNRYEGIARGYAWAMIDLREEAAKSRRKNRRKA